MRILVIADTNANSIKTVRPSGSKTEQYESKDAVLLEVAKLVNNGCTILSSSGNSITLYNDEGMSFYITKGSL